LLGREHRRQRASAKPIKPQTSSATASPLPAKMNQSFARTEACFVAVRGHVCTCTAIKYPEFADSIAG